MLFCQAFCYCPTSMCCAPSLCRDAWDVCTARGLPGLLQMRLGWSSKRTFARSSTELRAWERTYGGVVENHCCRNKKYINRSESGLQARPRMRFWPSIQALNVRRPSIIVRIESAFMGLSGYCWLMLWKSGSVGACSTITCHR